MLNAQNTHKAWVGYLYQAKNIISTCTVGCSGNQGQKKVENHFVFYKPKTSLLKHDYSKQNIQSIKLFVGLNALLINL